MLARRAALLVVALVLGSSAAAVATSPVVLVRVSVTGSESSLGRFVDLDRPYVDVVVSLSCNARSGQFALSVVPFAHQAAVASCFGVGQQTFAWGTLGPGTGVYSYDVDDATTFHLEVRGVPA